MTPNTRNAGLVLQVYSTSAAVPGPRVVGTMPGVVLIGAACRNAAPGEGTLALFDGMLSWTAPLGTSSGVPVDVSAGGAFMLEDGDDPSQWIAVETYPDYLPPVAQARVSFTDGYATGPTEADVTAANAAAGYTLSVEYKLVNLTPLALAHVKLWIDPAASGFADLTVSQDGTNYFQPSSAADLNVLSWSAVAIGGNVSLWVRRATSPASASEPNILNQLQWSWDGF